MTDQTSSTPIACPPCRGTGRLISKLGGEPHTVACGWCEGKGTLIAGHDAQAAHRSSSGR